MHKALADNSQALSPCMSGRRIGANTMAGLASLGTTCLFVGKGVRRPFWVGFRKIHVAQAYLCHTADQTGLRYASCMIR